jgi:hypothetical protein
MRLALLVLLALGGCGERRSFDERYATTQNELDERARKLDAASADSNAPARDAPEKH